MKIRTTIGLICLLAILTGLQSCFVGNYSYRSHWTENDWLQIPARDSMLHYPESAEYYTAKYAGHDGVYLDRRISRKHYGGLRKWNYYQVVKTRYIVLNPEEDGLTTFRLALGSEVQSLDSVYMTITSPEGLTQHFGREDLIVTSPSDEDVLFKFVYPNVRKGSMIEEGYIINTNSTMLTPMIQNHFHEFNSTLPSEKVTFRYSYPKHWKLMAKNFVREGTTDEGAPLDTVEYHDALGKSGNSSETEAAGDSSSGRIILREILSETPGSTKARGRAKLRGRTKSLVAQAHNMPAWGNEPWSPFRREVTQYLKFFVSEAASSNYILHSPKNFTDLVEHLRLDRNEITQIRNDEEIQKLATDVTLDAVTNVAKVDAINNWVQQNLRVTPRRSYDYNDVLSRGWGGISTVLEITVSMLKHAGIDAQLIMIHSARNGNFDPNYLTLNEFTFPGVIATKNSDTLVMFPQVKNLRAGLLPPAWQERPALIIGDDGTAEVGRSPRSVISENTQEEEYELTIGDDGLIRVKEVKLFRGLSAYNKRAAFEDMKKSKLDEAMKELLTYDEGEVKLEKYEIEHQYDNRQPLIITFHYTIDNLVTVAPDEVVLQTGGLLSPSSVLKTKVETKQRRNPIRIYSDELVKKKIVINYPKEWQLDTNLEPINFGNVFGELEATYTSEPGRLFVEQRRLLKQGDQPKEQIHELLKITGRESQLYVPTLIFAVKDM